MFLHNCDLPCLHPLWLHLLFRLEAWKAAHLRQCMKSLSIPVSSFLSLLTIDKPLLCTMGAARVRVLYRLPFSFLAKKILYPSYRFLCTATKKWSLWRNVDLVSKKKCGQIRGAFSSCLYGGEWEPRIEHPFVFGSCLNSKIRQFAYLRMCNFENTLLVLTPWFHSGKWIVFCLLIRVSDLGDALVIWFKLDHKLYGHFSDLDQVYLDIYLLSEPMNHA